jgi:voltage-gated potassium channel
MDSMQAIRNRLKIFLIIFLVLIISGTAGFMHLENRSLIDSLYFVIVTMATVGFGDVHPVTEGGKVFTIILIVMGVGTFLGVIGNVTEMLLAHREIESRMEKLNMVIGVFFSEVGLKLLTMFSSYDENFDTVRSELIITGRWTDEQFSRASRTMKSYGYKTSIGIPELKDLYSFLSGKRDFLIRLLENPVLLEHQTFTDLLRSVFHLAEEMAYRPEISNLPPTDRNHLSGDIKRAYHLLVDEWLNYMKYLKDNYPFLFSLALRTNPFDKKASVIVAE